MARRTQTSRVLAIAIVVAAAVVLILTLYRQHLLGPYGSVFALFDSAVMVPAEHVDAGNEGRRVRVGGKIEVAQVPRDAQLGISAAKAVALFRDVQMYQWRETCAGDDCRYEMVWSSQPLDSRKFRRAAGHENPAPPFASARFDASGVRIGAYSMDAALVVAQVRPDPFKIAASELPPNLAATFRIVDGVLYAGGDPAQPQVGEVKVSYRAVAPGKTILTGVQHGDRLASE